MKKIKIAFSVIFAVLTVLSFTAVISFAATDATTDKVYLEPIATAGPEIESIETENSFSFENSFYSETVGMDAFLNTFNSLENEKEDVVVAVIDTGVDYNHPALVGRVDTKHDIDFFDNDDDAMDVNGHGTMVAGLIAEGTEENVTILPIKIFGEKDTADLLSIKKGIEYAIECNVDVINMSLGSDGPDYLLSPCIQNAINAGITVVVSAGNDGVDCKNHTPANVESVITVAASTSRGQLFSFSNYGDCVDIVAPGKALCAVAGDTTYKTAQGTSLSAPIISACAANLKSYDKSLNYKDIELILKHFSVPIANEDRISSDTGIVNMSRVLAEECFELYTTNTGFEINEEFEIGYVCMPSADVNVSSAEGLWEYTGNGRQMKWLSSEGTHTLTFFTQTNTRTVSIKSLSECEHNWEFITVHGSTCISYGEYYQKCQKCGKESVHFFFDKLGDHSYGKWQTVTATCTTDGSRSRTCVYCNTTVTEAISALGHDYIEHSAKKVTCTENGWKAYQTCSRCEYSNYLEITATGHKLTKTEATAVTCNEAGNNEYYTCSNCNTVFTSEAATSVTTVDEQTIPALGHDWNIGEIKTHLTCTSDGVITYTCQRENCGKTKTEVIPATGHNYAWTVTKQPACTTSGISVGVCSCGFVVEKNIAKTGHTDSNHDNICDTCGDTINKNDDNSVSPPSFIQKILDFFSKLLSFFQNLGK